MFKMKSIKKALVFGCLTTLSALPSMSMNHNLLWPWGNPPRCSPPQTPLFAFWNKTNVNFMFKEGGDKIEVWCQAAVRTGSGLKWTLHHNMVDKPFCTGCAESFPGNLFRIDIPTSTLKPGFYDIRVELDGIGYEKLDLFYKASSDKPESVLPTGVCTFGWKPDEMPIVDEKDYKPADFERFWNSSMAEYRKIPLDVRIESEVKTFTRKEIDSYNLNHACLPPNFDPKGVKYDEVISYKISYAGPDGGRVYAWVARPKANGVYPALVVYPGAGTGGRPRPLDHARHGYVAMDVQVHGFDVEIKNPPARPWYNMPNENFPDEMPPVKELVWYDLHRRAFRAIDAILAQECVDKTRVAVCGGSQGGRLSIATAALDDRVKAAIPCIANSPNMPHLYWTKKCNASKYWWSKATLEEQVTQKTDGTLDYGNFKPPAISTIKKLAYYDPINFAPMARCPVYFNGGLIDPVSPAYSTYAAYLRWGGKNKTFIAVPGHAHDWWSAFDRNAYRWLDTIFR
jgi:cephalosporin-C deacetylase-like acetyl esterase